MNLNTIRETRNVIQKLKVINPTIYSSIPQQEEYFIPGVSKPSFPHAGETYDQINQYFSEQDIQARSIQEAREILGESANSLTDEQVNDLVNEIQYLVDSWIEEYEKNIFEGKTLEEVIKM